MANPSKPAIDWILSKVADWTPADAAILATLNATTVPNPTPQSQVAGPFTALGALGLISQASLQKLVAAGLVPAINETIKAGDRTGLASWATLASADALITPAEATAIQSYCAATQADPAYQANIPAPVAALGRTLDADDIHAARQAGGH